MIAGAGYVMTGASQGNAQCTIDGNVLFIAGVIDETTDLAAYGRKLRADAVVIDLGGVTLINSVGVREWVMLLDELTERGRQITLRNVSVPMVRQMTMVLKAKGSALVESFFAPYLCPKCGDESPLLIVVADHSAALAAGEPPALPCARCGTTSEFDEFPPRYLVFLT